MILACSTWPLSSSSRPCSVSICSKPSRPNRETAARPRSSATMIQIATPRKGPRFLVLLVLSAISGLVDRALEHAHVGKIAVGLRVIEAVADHELIGDVEADVLHVDVHPRGVGLAQQGGDLDALGSARAQIRQQPLQSQPGVDDVLDDQHVAAGDVGAEVLEDPHHAGGLGARAVGGEDRKSTRLNSSHVAISYAVFCLKKKI